MSGSLNPSGMCQCGCGEKAPIARCNRREWGWVKGESLRFIKNHHRRVNGFPKGVLVDECDMDLGKFSWYLRAPYNHVRSTVYAGPKSSEYLHRVIARRMVGRDLAEDEVVDHINGNPMDNRRQNLRVVSHAENLQNRTRPNSNNTSGYRGVVWHKNKWEATAKVGLRDFYIGGFDDPHRAAEALHQWRLKNMPGYTPDLYEKEKARSKTWE